MNLRRVVLRVAPLLLGAAAITLIAIGLTGSNPARVLADGVIQWQGHGSENLPCEGSAHWVLAPSFGVEGAVLRVDGQEYPMVQSGQGSWSVDSKGEVTENSVVFVVFTGEGDSRNHLQLSHCVGPEEPTETPTEEPTPTGTTVTSTATPTGTSTATPTSTSTATPTGTQPTRAASPSPTPTESPTETPTGTTVPTETPTETPTMTFTTTVTPTVTVTVTSTPTEIPTETPTSTPQPPQAGGGFVEKSESSDSWGIYLGTALVAVSFGAVAYAAHRIRRRI